jgi:putative protease
MRRRAKIKTAHCGKYGESIMKKKIELLAPAGNYDAFLAAIENGADAVYLGGKLLNARQFAGNFDEEELERALDYAHTRDAKVLLTLNTLVLDNEMQEALEYAGKAYEMGADAFIVQDLGLISNLKKAIPDISIHASTQMTIYNKAGLSAIEKMGLSRAVLARELTLSEIADICSNTSLEIEVFTHGALCICYSGQCLMSSIIGGRSGNRGKCAQPCRLPYSILKDNNHIKSGYLLSPKDICFIENLADLINAGVSSLKIEGRMKSPEYVAAVVRTYRKYLNEIEQISRLPDNKEKNRSGVKVSEEDMHQLLQSFNRGGFSKGYLRGKTGPDMMSYEKPKNWGTYLGVAIAYDRSANVVKLKLDSSLGNGDGIEIWSDNILKDSPGGIITKIVKDGTQVKRAHKGDIVWVSVVKGNVEKGAKVFKTSDKEMLEQAAASFAKASRKLDISAEFSLKLGQLPVLYLWDGNGNSVSAAGDIMPEKAINKPLSEERISEQLKKMGSTPFNVEKLTLNLDNDVVIPISELNNIRRKAAELLENKRILSSKRRINTGNKDLFNSLLDFPGNSHDRNKKVKISAMLYNLDENTELEKINADRLYIPFTSLLNEAVKNKTSKLKEEGKEIFAYVPAVIKGKYSEIIEKNVQSIVQAVDGFLVGNIGVAQLLDDMSDKSIQLMGDYSLNVLNSSTLNYYKELGYIGTTLSYELNLSQLNSISIPEGFDTEIGVYGKIPVMTSEYCPIGGSAGNNEPARCNTICKNGVYHLKDRKGARFLVKSDCTDCRSTIYNADIIFAPELLNNIAKTGVKYLRLSFIDESAEEIYDIVNLHRSIVEDKNNYDKDRVIKNIKEKGFTKGHLQRGV